MRAMLLLAAFVSVPTGAQTDIGTANLGTLGSASGTATFSEAASYNPADEQRYRFTFNAASAGTLKVSLFYEDELKSPLVEVCPDPNDPDSCSVEPNGDYQDYSGVRLTRFILSPTGGAGSETALPTGFIDSLSGERSGRGYQSFGFDAVWTSYWLENPFVIGAGSFTADLYGYGLIRGPGFGGEGRGVVSYGFEFTAVPEPASWALMVAGFGLAGLGLRRAQRDGLRIVPA